MALGSFAYFIFLKQSQPAPSFPSAQQRFAAQLYSNPPNQNFPRESILAYDHLRRESEEIHSWVKSIADAIQEKQYDSSDMSRYEKQLKSLPSDTFRYEQQPKSLSSNALHLLTPRQEVDVANGKDGLPIGHENIVEFVRLELLRRPGHFLSVGHDLVTPKDQECWLHARKGLSSTSENEDSISPMTTFEVVPGSGRGKGTVSLRSMSNGMFVRAVIPGMKGPTWVLMADVSDHRNVAAQFRLEQSDSTSYLYSIGARGYVNLPVSGTDDVRCHGSPARKQQRAGAPKSPDAALAVHTLSPEEVSKARRLHAASRDTLESQRAIQQVNNHAGKQVTSGHIAIGTAVTSKGTHMNSVEESPFFRILLPSFLATWEGPGSSFRYTFYIGFDAGDNVYDKSSSRAAFTKLFRERVNGASNIALVQLSFRDTTGAPSWAVANVMKQAYEDGAEWLYQLNDDARLVTRGWERSLCSALASNPVAPFVGATGPTDKGNGRIFTHVFTHRTHIDIHGRFFPKAFRNYYSDDWITHVYGSSSTFKMPNVKMTHETKAQKTGKIERYSPDHKAKLALAGEVDIGALKVARWVHERGHAQFPLDEICGYAPLVEQLQLGSSGDP